MIKTHLLIEALRFVMTAKGKDPVRRYLNAVQFRFESPCGLAMVATDGHRLHKVELPTIDHDIDGGAIFTVHGADIETLLRTIKTGKSDKTRSVIAFSPEMLHVLHKDGQSYYLHPAPDQFPQWEAVIPSGNLIATERFGIDAGYVADSLKAIRRLTGKDHIAIDMRGPEAAVSITPETPTDGINPLCIIMPVRLSA